MERQYVCRIRSRISSSDLKFWPSTVRAVRLPVTGVVGNRFVCLARRLSPSTDTLCQIISMQSELLVYVPNAFTPGNDGLNDLLTPSVLGLLQSTYHFQVFDRWGHIVFESYTVGEGWNGSFQNGTHYVQEDVYLWRIEGQDVRSADVVTLQGHVTVVR